MLRGAKGLEVLDVSGWVALSRRPIDMARLPGEARFEALGRAYQRRDSWFADQVVFVSPGNTLALPTVRLNCDGRMFFTGAKSVADVEAVTAALHAALPKWGGVEAPPQRSEPVVTTATLAVSMGPGFDFAGARRVIGGPSANGTQVTMASRWHHDGKSATVTVCKTGAAMTMTVRAEDEASARTLLVDVVLPMVAPFCGGAVGLVKARQRARIAAELSSAVLVAGRFGVPAHVVATHVGKHVREEYGGSRVVAAAVVGLLMTGALAM